MFFKKKTTDDVISDINQKIDDLKRIADTELKEAERCADEIMILESKREVRQKESNRASKLSQKFAELVDVGE